MAIVIKDGYVLTGDREQPCFQRASLLIKGDSIAAIVPDIADIPEANALDVEVIDASRSLVLPGFVNAHMHSNESFEQGAYDRLPLELWLLHKYPPLITPPLTKDDQYLRTMLCAIRSIKSGVTSIQDDVINYGSLDVIAGACAAYRDAGLRAWVTADMGDRQFLEPLPWLDELMPTDLKQELAAIPNPHWQEQIALFEQAYADWHGVDDRIRMILGPVGPQWCSTELLQAVTEISQARDLPVHMHCLETKTQAVTAEWLYGKPVIKYLHEIGFLTPRVTLNHAIWLSDREIELLGKHHCSITHNPLSNLKLGSGICQVRKLLKAGVNVELGTDGVCTSDTADIFTALSAAALLHRIGTFNYDEWITAEEAYFMATIAGAYSGLMQSEVGSLAVGKKADVILVDRYHWGLIPLNHPLKQLAFSTTSDAVQTSIINGRIVMRDRVLTLVDEAALNQEISEVAEYYLRELFPKMTAIAQRYEPYFRAIYERATESEIPTHITSVHFGETEKMKSKSIQDEV
ncbi:cytosine deaminase-like metal-dependent hydrolase [Leptolyngbyaceae cyanobacterium JSC-12]|nr:cytosine deaminase-like metal-dependent hydrolase [Leptolyngbyaceae cyanobacterium JSC-12]